MFLGSIFLISCASTKNVTYFNNVKDTTFYSGTTVIQKPIEANDIMSIVISSANADASRDFNIQSNNTTTTTATGSNTQSGGYLVNADGNIELPILGTVKAAGLTKDQLRVNIVNLILSKKQLIDPIVDIRFLNYEVTVLGEVNHPTVITVPSEKITLLKALGLAGDLTIYGKRENVLLIREEGNKKITRHIDLNSADFFNSPYYYLQPNDVIYVEPNRNKAASAVRNQQILPIVISALSVVAIVIDRLVR